MPQVRLPFLLALFAAAAAALVFALTHHTTAQQQAAYDHAEAQLAAQKLPSYLAPTAGCGGTLCGHSPVNPPELLARIRAYVPDAEPFPVSLPCPFPARLCPINYLGRFHGYGMIATVMWHMLPISTTRPPTGSASYRHGHRTFYFDGSDVTFELATPKALNG